MSTVSGTAAAYADTWRDQQWHLDFLRADAVHKLTQGAGATVAVVDSGVKADHPDLKGNVLKGEDFIDKGGDGQKDTYGHGTAMASLIAGHGHSSGRADGVLGLAPAAKVFPVRTLIEDSDPEGDLERVVDGIESAMFSDAKVINFSGEMSGTRRTVEWAMSRDIVFVAAAGNSDEKSWVQQPASFPGVVAVSGVDRSGRFDPDVSVEGPEVVVAAPAVDLAGAWAGKLGPYYVGSGTSGATALVSATAALIRAKYPDLSANGVINRLIKTADDKGAPGRDPKYGFGVVNPLKALTADIPDIDYNPLSGARSTATPSRVADASTPAAINPDDIDDGGGLPGWVIPGIAGAAAGLAVAVGYAVVQRRRRARLREVEDRLVAAIELVTSAYPPTGPPGLQGPPRPPGMPPGSPLAPPPL